MDSEQKKPDSSPAAVIHSLPHLPTMGRSMRTVQSKSSAKIRPKCSEKQEETVLHVEGTSKVITISREGVSQLTEIKSKETEESFTPQESGALGQSTQDIEIASTPNESSSLKRKSLPRSGKTFANLAQGTDVETKTAKDNGDGNTVGKDEIFSKTSYLQERKKAVRLNKPIGNKTVSPQPNETRLKFSKRSLASKVIPDKFQTSEPLNKSSEISAEGKVNLPDKEVNALGPHIPRQVLIFPGELPSEEQIEKMKASCTEASLLQNPVLLAEGDMQWGKVTGHPYWPCMISKCPFSELVTRVKGDARTVRLYHVQFFGDECERGWIAEPSLIKFQGKSDFIQRAKDSLQRPYKKGQTTYNPFNVKENRQDAWNAAVEEAEQAAGLSVEDRKLQYAFNYHFVDKSKKETKDMKKVAEVCKKSPKVRGRKRKISDTGSDSIGSVSKRLRIVLSPKSPLKKTIPFQVYFSNHSAVAREQHPEMDPETLRIFLRNQWKAERRSFASPEVNASPRKTQNGHLVCPKSPLQPLQRGVPFQVYFSLHSASAHEEHPEWDSERLRIYLRKQWKLERMVKSPITVSGMSPKSFLTDVVSYRLPVESTENKQVSKSPLHFFQPNGTQDTQQQDKKSDLEKFLGKKRERTQRKIDNGSEPITVESVQEKNEEDEPEEFDIKIELDIDTSELLEYGPAAEEDISKIVHNQVEDNSSLSKRKRTSKILMKDQLRSDSPLSHDSMINDIAEEDMAALKARAILARKSSQDSDSSSESKGRRDEEPYELEIFKLLSTCKIDKDKVCGICEKFGELIDCTGSCGQHFHPACVNLEVKPEQSFVCAECVSGVHTCFSCKQTDNSTIKCAISLCGKYYHEACVKKHRLTRHEAKGFVCPMHTCASCAVDDIKNPKAFKGRYYRCIRCPVSYHVGDHCIPAGSVVIAGSNILCADHFTPNKALSCHSRLNITWCFTCSKGGTLICCEGCPAAYHAECVKMEKAPDEAWFCEECEAGRRPLYGTIVWIKVGNYRWWPGEICHPRNVPKNIQEKSHKIGEFPVRFFGSHDYYWIHRGRVFLFQEGDKASRDGSAKGLFKTYKRGVEEATDAFKIWSAFKDKKDVQEQERKEKRPPPYKFVKGNVPIGNVHITKADLSEIPVCDCKPDQEDACKSDCLNRMMLYECHPSICPAGEKCNNQRFQKRLYVEAEPYKCENRGWGLRCLQDIKKGQFVIEYVGDLIDEEECKKRIEQAHDDNITNFYMLTLDKNRIIDAGPKGNCSRFMNHSCCPNLVTQKWTVNGDIRVGLFALEDIPKGSELTFNYNLECLGNEKKACMCGADNCSGFLGVRPKANLPGTAKEKLAKELKKKRKKKKLEKRKIYEDECFRCGVGGELVMCDVANCPKVYHLHCLKLTKPPIGKWRCPWHHCDVCGKHAVNKCVECPDSFCLSHSDGNIFEKNGVQVCEDHFDLLESLMQPFAKDDTSMNEVQAEETQKCGRNSGLPLKETAEINLPSVNSHADGVCKSITKNDTCIEPQPKVKRKYTKRIKSELVDSHSTKCPVLKISVAKNKQSNSEKNDFGSKSKFISESGDNGRSKSIKRNSVKLDSEALANSLTNGLHMPLSSPLNGKLGPLSSLQVKDSDDADSPSSLVIDLA